jgi:hypothetical protein
MKEKDLIGKKITGFRFSGGPVFVDEMEKTIGKEGVVVSQVPNVCFVSFGFGQGWNYPYPEILEHLVEKEKKTTEELVAELQKLISKI